jgi:hypothetical protein
MATQKQIQANRLNARKSTGPRFRRVEGQMWENPIFEITFAKAFRDDSDHFTRLQRRIDSTQRNYRNALHELQRLQPEAPSPDPDHNPAPQNQPVSTPNGFVPQPSPQDLVPTPPTSSKPPTQAGMDDPFYEASPHPPGA